MGSKSWAISKEELIKIGKGALIALGGALLTYLTTVISKVDFGVWTPVVVAGWSVIVNFCRKFFPDTSNSK